MSSLLNNGLCDKCHKRSTDVMATHPLDEERSGIFDDAESDYENSDKITGADKIRASKSTSLKEEFYQAFLGQRQKASRVKQVDTKPASIKLDKKGDSKPIISSIKNKSTADKSDTLKNAFYNNFNSQNRNISNVQFHMQSKFITQNRNISNVQFHMKPASEKLDKRNDYRPSDTSAKPTTLYHVKDRNFPTEHNAKPRRVSYAENVKFASLVHEKDDEEHSLLVSNLLSQKDESNSSRVGILSSNTVKFSKMVSNLLVSMERSNRSQIRLPFGKSEHTLIDYGGRNLSSRKKQPSFVDVKHSLLLSSFLSAKEKSKTSRSRFRRLKLPSPYSLTGDVKQHCLLVSNLISSMDRSYRSQLVLPFRKSKHTVKDYRKRNTFRRNEFYSVAHNKR